MLALQMGAWGFNLPNLISQPSLSIGNGPPLHCQFNAQATGYTVVEKLKNSVDEADRKLALARMKAADAKEVRTATHMYVCMCVCMYVCMCVCVYRMWTM